jgi:methyl-accepting chemotaxis protein
LKAFNHYSDVFVKLTQQHTALYDLLYSAGKIDEATLYDKAKQHLYEVQHAVQALEQALPPVNENMASGFAALRNELSANAEAYRKGVSAAVGMVTVNLALAPGQLGLALGRFTAMNRSFVGLLNLERERISSEITARVRQSQISSATIAIVGVSLAALLFFLSHVLSRILSRSIETQIGILTDLGTQAGARMAVEGSDEVARITLAITAFRQSLQDLRDSRDDLEQRVLERTQEVQRGKAAAENANQVTGEFLARLASILDVMRTGDLSGRLDVGRGGEFGTLATGFNRMTDELAGLVGQVQKSGIQVNASVDEIAATAKQQQATASEIAATTTEIGATSKEISATSKELVRTMNEVSVVAEQSASLAGGGQVGLTRMEETMRHVMDAAGSINAKLAVLNEKAGNINQVVTTITKVADQTNLLSLNAAIEAEKAGEYGRGFAVVATEIRRLADQTAVATYDIEQMVKEIQSAVSAGVMGMDKFSEEVRRGMHEIEQVGGQLSQIIQQVEALAPRVESVNEGMQAQATGAEQITEALGQLSQAAQQTVESLRHSGVALDGLNQVSTDLRSGVSRFKLVA